MNGFRDQMFVRTGSLVHHVRLDGSMSGPVVLFANSLGTDLRIWDDVVQRLEGFAGIVRYDMRGHGLTAAPDPPYSIEDLAGDVEQLMDALGIPRVTICGVSVGGMVALKVGARRRTQTQGLVLCDTGYRIGPGTLWNARIAAVTESGMPAIAEAVIARWFSGRYRATRTDEAAGYRCMLERCTVAGYAGVCAAIRDADLEEVAGTIRCPAVVVCGEEDQATSPALNRLLAGAIPGARFEVIPGAGHLPCIEEPSIVAAHIRSLIENYPHD